MTSSPTPINLEIQPKSRFSLIDVNQLVKQERGDILAQYEKSLYCSFHTTAGYLEESLCDNLDRKGEQVEPFISSFQKLFPPEADYRHDRMELREELDAEQRKLEPKNADSHLVFIGAGMKNCVTYVNKPNRPVYFIELDGLNGKSSRQRKTTVLAYNEEKPIHTERVAIPVSKHPIDSINLKDSNREFLEQLNDIVRKYDVTYGKIDLELADDEKYAGLTVNEFETLLMTHDLKEVVHNPLKYVAQKGKHALAAPSLIPGKTLDYAKYDLVQLFNKIMDTMGVSETIIERVLSVILRVPASHFLSMKRHISLFVRDEPEQNGNGRIAFGRYQSPILVQWNKAKGETRHVNVTLSKFA